MSFVNALHPATVARAILAGAALSLFSVAAQASVVWTDSDTIGGNAVSASATFTITGTQLVISLQNTSPGNAKETPTSTLTGLTFLLNGLDPVLTPVSAVSPNAILNAVDCDAMACTSTNVNVGGEWGYQHNYSGVEAVASSGYITTGLTQDLGNFNGSNLENPASLDGIEFGIVSANYGPLNGGLDSQALIDDTVTLTLTLPSSILESQIGSVSFLYGTSPDATEAGTACTTCTVTQHQDVPEPSSLAIFGSALGIAGLLRRRKRKE